MKEYKATRVSDAPVWEDIDVIEIDNKYLDTPDGIEAYAQLAYDDTRLYVHLYKIEEDTLATQTGPASAPCLDSCLEFFFCPEENDKRYFNIEFNSLGCVFFGFGTSGADLLRILAEDGDTAKYFEPIIEKTECGWEIFYTVPYSLIRRVFPDFEMKDGKTMRANFFTCADNTCPPHYKSWSEVTGEPFTFHKQHCFGIIKF